MLSMRDALYTLHEMGHFDFQTGFTLHVSYRVDGLAELNVLQVFTLYLYLYPYPTTPILTLALILTLSLTLTLIPTRTRTQTQTFNPPQAKLLGEIKSWEAVVLRARESHYFLNYFTMREVKQIPDNFNNILSSKKFYTILIQ
jgi:hypothetical protein